MIKEQKTKGHPVIPTVAHWSKVWFPGCGVCKCTHNKVVRLREDTKDMFGGCKSIGILEPHWIAYPASGDSKHVAYKSQYDKPTRHSIGGLI